MLIKTIHVDGQEIKTGILIFISVTTPNYCDMDGEMNFVFIANNWTCGQFCRAANLIDFYLAHPFLKPVF